MSKRAIIAAYDAYPLNESNHLNHEYNAKRVGFYQGYEQAEKDIISIIESRLAELLGDAQPTPILRYELRDLIKIIKGEEK